MSVPITELPCVFGPRTGYTPQIGILVSQLNWMRGAVLQRAKALSVEDLDWRRTPESNSIGALLLHLAATDVYYAHNTFDGHTLATIPAETRKRWGAAMRLGELGRTRIVGNELAVYLDALATTRAGTLAQLQSRDDDWLFAVDPDWVWGPTNNLCKWFHVCEHESHHLGQIDLLLKDLPSRRSPPLTSS